jgi:hypothetical protein
VTPRALSLTSCFAKAKHQGAILSSFTCFVFRRGDEDFLVTAWHNLSGRRSDNLELLHSELRSDRAVPNEIEVDIPFISDEGHVFTIEVRFNLYPTALNGSPLWFVHPAFGHKVDVAVLSLREICQHNAQAQFLSGRWETTSGRFEMLIGSRDFVVVHEEIPLRVRYEPVNVQATSDLASQVGDDVFIVGFPRALKPTGIFPIWKKGSIASEPDVDAYDLPMLLVDSMPREGLSGAAVLQLRPTGSVTLHGKGHLSLISGESPKFLGVYVGRDHGDPTVAQLGRVIKSTAVRDICIARRQGASAVVLDNLRQEAAE